MERLPKQSLEVLKALSYFHYLTSQQLVDLGIAKSVDSLNNWALAKLLPPPKSKGGTSKPSRNYCNSLRYGNTDAAQAGVKLPYMHYMTQRGRDYLQWACEEELAGEDIWIPTPKEVLTNDYFHRQYYVDAHIAIRRWAQQVGAEIDFWTHDYQGDPYRPTNSIGRPPSVNAITLEDGREIKPDGIFGMTYQGESRLFVLELHNRTPTKRVVNQLYRNFEARTELAQKFVKFTQVKDPYVLSVFVERERMKAAQKFVAKNQAFAPVIRGLMFTDLELLKALPDASWAFAEGGNASLFKTA